MLDVQRNTHQHVSGKFCVQNVLNSLCIHMQSLPLSVRLSQVLKCQSKNKTKKRSKILLLFQRWCGDSVWLKHDFRHEWQVQKYFRLHTFFWFTFYLYGIFHSLLLLNALLLRLNWIDFIAIYNHFDCMCDGCMLQWCSWWLCFSTIDFNTKFFNRWSDSQFDVRKRVRSDNEREGKISAMLRFINLNGQCFAAQSVCVSAFFCNRRCIYLYVWIDQKRTKWTDLRYTLNQSNTNTKVVLVHATHFAESTSDCTIRIEKYSSHWRIFFLLDAIGFFALLLCM